MNQPFNPSGTLAKALLCSLLAVVMAVSPDAAWAKRKKTIGIQLYSVMDAVQRDPAASVARLADMGYGAFELVQWGGNPTIFGLPADEFKALCDAKGVAIVSTHSGLQEDPAREEEIMRTWRELFATVKACGGRYFVVPSYSVEYTVQDVQRMCDYLNRVGRIAAEYGLKLGYHNHDGEYRTLKGSDQVMWEYLVEHTDPQYVCFELDVYWCTKGGKDPVAYLKKYPRRIELLHIKDEFVIGQSGTIDFESIFKQFRKNGQSVYFVEIETPRELSERTNPDGSRYTREQIMEEMFEAARQSAEWLHEAKFVK